MRGARRGGDGMEDDGIGDNDTAEDTDNADSGRPSMGAWPQAPLNYKIPKKTKLG